MFNSGEYFQDIEINNEIDKLEMEKRTSSPSNRTSMHNNNNNNNNDGLHNPFTLAEIINNQYSDILPNLLPNNQTTTYQQIEFKNHVFVPPLHLVNIPSASSSSTNNFSENGAINLSTPTKKKLKKIRPNILEPVVTQNTDNKREASKEEQNLEPEKRKLNDDTVAEYKAEIECYKHLSKKHKQLKIYNVQKKEEKDQEAIENEEDNTRSSFSSSKAIKSENDDSPVKKESAKSGFSAAASASNQGEQIPTSSSLTEPDQTKTRPKKLPELAVKFMVIFKTNNSICLVLDKINLIHLRTSGT
jgi:hypothetical protein